MSSPATKVNVQHESIRIRGVVQGVGFRPTVWRIANDMGLRGFALNDAEGVLVDTWGTDDEIEQFCTRVQDECPPLSRIDSIERTVSPDRVEMPDNFKISDSKEGIAKTSVVADAGVCEACAKEALDPFSRRYRYPFTNCTNCGPRLTIIQGIPYDRAMTSMSAFQMCPECQEEYDNPEDRRFHAQPNACHACGPKAQLIRADGHVLCTENLTQLDDVDAACTLIQNGEVVAIKGIGGFHLACDATNRSVVDKLRQRKHRFEKPFALMAANLNIIREYCEVSDEEEALLESPAAPIVVLER